MASEREPNSKNQILAWDHPPNGDRRVIDRANGDGSRTRRGVVVAWRPRGPLCGCIRCGGVALELRRHFQHTPLGNEGDPAPKFALRVAWPKPRRGQSVGPPGYPAASGRRAQQYGGGGSVRFSPSGIAGIELRQYKFGFFSQMVLSISKNVTSILVI